jgi:hypothetical protein
MHEIEPFFNWRNFYTAETDKLSPFYRRKYSELYFTNTIYNYVIHPQWDEFGSPSLYTKILYVDYEQGYAILELIGEWNDAIHNDVMFLKREIVDVMLQHDVTKFILIGENVLNYHFDGDDYYDEWFQDVEEGWIAFLNFREHVLQEFTHNNIDYYINYGGELDTLPWRTSVPQKLFEFVESTLQKRLK